ncbi:MFS transporter [Actinokineospora bangkokensis]|uniref:MFS transporter n=1 Tax=Actinokineospora bangkokensis TaxID=1193682 RepID=A0A1Q9LJQ7_9PSEU|nr:MFS transporter [Actinokineospora bangkokensis]OLR92276.1 MFS transporter [Actinokineospora bangkokensis]
MSTPGTTRGTGTARSGGSPLALGIAFLTLLLIGTDLFLVSPLLPAIAAAHGVSTGAAGTSVTAFSAAYVVGAPLGGALADRVGRRGVLVVGLTGFALANVLTGLPLGFAVLLVARVLAGLFAAGVTPSLLALVGQSAPPARRGVWLSTAMAGFLVSLTTGAPTGTAVAAALGWEAAFLGLGVLTLVLAVVNRFTWPRGAGAVAAAPGARKLPLTTKLRAASVTGTWAFAVYSFYTYLGAGLADVAGFTTGTTALALVVYGLGAVAGSLSGGTLADRHGAGRVVATSLLVLGVVLLVVDALLGAPAWLLIACLGLFALLAYPCLPAYQSRLVATFPAESGSVLAWNSSFMYLGTSLGSAVGGLLLSAGFRWIPIAGAVAAALGVVVHHRWSLPGRPVEVAA